MFVRRIGSVDVVCGRRNRKAVESALFVETVRKVWTHVSMAVSILLISQGRWTYQQEKQHSSLLYRTTSRGHERVVDDFEIVDSILVHAGHEFQNVQKFLWKAMDPESGPPKVFTEESLLGFSALL